MRFHPVAELFPLLEGDEYKKLVADIRANGLREKIWLHPDGSIVDGRNRYRACIESGVEPQFRTWSGEGSLVSFVVSLNLHRRHLDPSQRAAIALDVLPMLEQGARERQRGGQGGILLREKIPEATGKATEKAAETFNTNSRYISDAKKIKEVAPEKFEEIKAGKKTIPEVKRELKELAREQRRAENAALVEEADVFEEIIKLENVFSTIVIDPPWDWNDEGDVDQFGRARPPYKTIPYEELLALPVGIKAADDAHIYLWITNRSLPKGFPLLESWGFRYITMLTWHKPSIGMGNYFRGSTEHVLFGVRGSLLLKRKDIGTLFEADRGNKFSEKPDEFYALVESASPGPYLDIFARKKRTGWKMLGAEILDELVNDDERAG